MITVNNFVLFIIINKYLWLVKITHVACRNRIGILKLQLTMGYIVSLEHNSSISNQIFKYDLVITYKFYHFLIICYRVLAYKL